MMFRLILFFYLFYSYQAFGFGFACKFEEVYIDGQTQQGLLLIKKINLGMNTATRIYILLFIRITTQL